MRCTAAQTWEREVLAHTAAWRCAFSSQRVALQRSLISRSFSKSGVTKPLPSGQYARGLFDLLFVHDFHSSPSRGTVCPVEESLPSWDTAQTLGGWPSAHMFLDSKFAKEKCVSLPTMCYAGGFDSCTASSWWGGGIDRGQKSPSSTYHLYSL